MDATVASVFGCVPSDPELKLKLYLNAEPARARNCFDLTRAFAVALGQESMPDEWIRAVAQTPEELSLWRRHEAKRVLSLKRL